MLTIGALAELAGTTTRAVRHYHAMGVLPEPARRTNGYREYDMRDAVRLVRVRRLIALGLSLPEVADALRDRDETGLREVLVELDADLERQERMIADRRRRVADLLARPSDVAVSDRVAGLLSEVGRAVPDAPPEALARERELLEMLEAGGDAASFEEFAGQYRQMLADPDSLAQLSAVATRFEALADADPEAPQVAELAGLLADVGAAQILYQPAGDDAWQPTWSAFLATLPPAQRRCMELAWELRARVAP